MNDIYDDLKLAPLSDLINSAVSEYRRQGRTEFAEGILEGYAISQPDGWKHIAPIWLVDKED